MKIQLTEGYTDNKDNKHTEVEFGHRPTVLDLIALDNDPQGKNPTQYTALLQRKMMTKFGTLTMPVALNVLLGLDAIDREDLSNAADRFLAETREDRTAEYRDGNVVKMRFGFEIDGTRYEVAHFGKLTTGRDEVEADALGNSVANSAFLIGRQIVKISTEDELAHVDGAVSLDVFQTLDAEDFNLLRVGAELFRTSFRIKRAELQEKRKRDERVSTDAGNGDERKGDSGSAENED